MNRQKVKVLKQESPSCIRSTETNTKLYCL